MNRSHSFIPLLAVTAVAGLLAGLPAHVHADAVDEYLQSTVLNVAWGDADLSLSVDREPLPLQIVSIEFAPIESFAEGAGDIRLAVSAPLPRRSPTALVLGLALLLVLASGGALILWRRLRAAQRAS